MIPKLAQQFLEVVAVAQRFRVLEAFALRLTPNSASAIDCKSCVIHQNKKTNSVVAKPPETPIVDTSPPSASVVD